MDDRELSERLTNIENNSKKTLQKITELIETLIQDQEEEIEEPEEPKNYYTKEDNPKKVNIKRKEEE